jgi:predicted RNase H-like HicB family nuclease
MRSIIQFNISKGKKYYIASGVDFPVVTQAKSLDELIQNIREAVSLHLEGEEASNSNLNPSPSIMVGFELPVPSYA